MISVPIIYADNETQIGSDLSIPARRMPVWKNWFTAILTPQQWLNDLVFNNYYGGSSAPDWVSGNTYTYGQRVKFTDYSVYEVVNLNGVTDTSPTNPNNDTANWIKVLDTFVGVGERVLYTGQLIMLEYILNYYFSVGSVSLPWTGANHSTQIYISPGSVGFGFWMSANNLEPLTSYMSASNAAQKNFMGASPSFNPNTFTINVPTAVDAAITANQVAGVTAEDVIRSIADKYVQAGKIYNYVTY